MQSFETKRRSSPKTLLIFHKIHASKKIFWQVLRGAPRRFNIAHDQARSQDFERAGRAFFERVRQQYATLTRIFIAFATDSNGLSEIDTDFSAQKQVISKKKKIFTEKKHFFFTELRRIFRPKSEIQTVLPAESRQVLHNFGTQIPSGGAVFFFEKNWPQKH